MQKRLKIRSSKSSVYTAPMWSAGAAEALAFCVVSARVISATPSLNDCAPMEHQSSTRCHWFEQSHKPRVHPLSFLIDVRRSADDGRLEVWGTPWRPSCQANAAPPGGFAFRAPGFADFFGLPLALLLIFPLPTMRFLAMRSPLRIVPMLYAIQASDGNGICAFDRAIRSGDLPAGCRLCRISCFLD